MPRLIQQRFCACTDNRIINIISTIPQNLYVISKVKKADLKLTHRFVGYCWNNLEKPILMRGPKPLLAEFGSHHRLEIGEF